VNLEVLATGVLVIHLAVVTWIDLKQMIIPDLLNLSLAVFGLFASHFFLHWPLTQIILQAATVYGAFYIIAEIYKNLRGKSGLGGGDVKFMGAATFWVGALAVPWVILIACFSGLATIIAMQLARQKIELGHRIAFGPHLSSGLLVTWLFRDTISLTGI
jgi:leader peptidase (prepilin peptidase) / N-methyltransferase